MALLFPRIRNEEYCEKLNDPRDRFSFSLWLMKRLQNCEYFTIGGWTAAAAATAAAVFRKQSSWWFRWKEGPLARKHIGKPTGERDIYKGAIGLCRLHSRGCWFASGQVAVPLHLLEQVSCSRVVGERRSGSVTVGYKSRGQIINWSFFPPPTYCLFFSCFLSATSLRAGSQWETLSCSLKDMIRCCFWMTGPPLYCCILQSVNNQKKNEPKTV